MLAGLLVACLGIALVLSGPRALFYVGASAAGLGLAPQYATAIALYQRRAAAASGQWLGPVLAAGGLGGATMPFLLGIASSWSGNLTFAGWGLPPLLGLMILILAGVSESNGGADDNRKSE